MYKPLTSLKSDIWNTRLYTGREYDREIGLYYLRARYYDPNLARFTSRDPIGMKDNINLYTYVANSPVMYTDRMGLEKVLIIGFLWRSFSNGEVSFDKYSESWIWSIINNVSDKNTISKLYHTNTFSPSDWITDAYNYIKQNRMTFDKIIILWHSMGADNAVELSDKLFNDSIEVDMLITLDLQSYWDSTEIHSNVLSARNYYQSNFLDTEWSPVEFINPNWDFLYTAWWNSITDLTNINATQYCNVQQCPNDSWSQTLYHTTIDQWLSGIISREIQSNIY